MASTEPLDDRAYACMSEANGLQSVGKAKRCWPATIDKSPSSSRLGPFGFADDKPRQQGRNDNPAPDDARTNRTQRTCVTNSATGWR